jgi:hypothetical protein
MKFVTGILDHIFVFPINFHGMSSNTARLPYLPPELERLIFELAVIEHGPEFSVNYLLVARRVNIW